MADTGLRVEKASYYNAFLFPVVAAVRLAQRLGKSNSPVQSDVKMPHLWVNRLLEGVLSSERWVLRKATFPVGVSIIALGRVD